MRELTFLMGKSSCFGYLFGMRRLVFYGLALPFILGLFSRCLHMDGIVVVCFWFISVLLIIRLRMACFELLLCVILIKELLVVYLHWLDLLVVAIISIGASIENILI